MWTLLSAKNGSYADMPSTDIGEGLINKSNDGGPGQFQCCLCLDNTSAKGITCNADGAQPHFICQSCFSPYVNSLCEESFKLLDSGGQITCPVPQCCARPWSSHVVRNVVVGDVLEKYIDILVLSLQRMTKNDSSNQKEISPNSSADTLNRTTNGNSAEAIPKSNSKDDMHRIIDAMTLKCPNKSCNFALDPTPDGCCAMRCYSCGSHFCWLCLTTQDNSLKCHAHVRTCKENPTPNNLFLSPEHLDFVHKKRIIESIRRALNSLDDSHEDSERQPTVITAADISLNISDTTDVLTYIRNSNERNELDSYNDDDEVNIDTENNGVIVESAWWQKSKRCIETIERVKPLLRDSGITTDEIFESAALYPTNSPSDTDSANHSSFLPGSWDKIAVDFTKELKNSQCILLIFLELFLGWRMVSTFVCQLLGISSWYLTSVLWAIAASLAVWRPAEVVIAYFILGFFQFVKYFVTVRGFILANSFYIQLFITSVVGVYVTRYANTTESNMIIIGVHLAGIFLLDLTLFIAGR